MQTGGGTRRGPGLCGIGLLAGGPGWSDTYPPSAANWLSAGRSLSIYSWDTNGVVSDTPCVALGLCGFDI